MYFNGAGGALRRSVVVVLNKSIGNFIGLFFLPRSCLLLAKALGAAVGTFCLVAIDGLAV